MKLLPYKMTSKGAKALAEALDIKRLKLINSSYTPRQPITVINWGTSAQKTPDRLYRNPDITWVNHPDNVTIASNKLLSFQRLKGAGVSVPEFTDCVPLAKQWFNSGSHFMARSLLRGSSGNGCLYIACDPDVYADWDIDSKLFVKYIKKSAEYRIHISNGQTVDIQQKRKRKELNNEEVDYQIRSHANGWVFCRDDIDSPDDSVLTEAVNAVSALGLDFGAVDVIWNSYQQKAFVLEVNTAPGLEGTTLIKYKEALGA